MGMDRYWIVTILFWPKDEDGNRKDMREPRQDNGSLRDKMREFWIRRGASRAQEELLWEQQQWQKRDKSPSMSPLLRS